MQIGIPTETIAGENRVAATPETVKKLISAGHRVLIERGAGVRAAYIDSAYEQIGATITENVNTGQEHRNSTQYTHDIDALKIDTAFYTNHG